MRDFAVTPSFHIHPETTIASAGGKTWIDRISTAS
jgi:hypothetical protein